MKVGRRKVTTGLLLLIIVVLIAACSQNTTNGNRANENERQEPASSNSSVSAVDKTDELEFVELSYFFPYTEQIEQSMVFDELNKQLKEKINAKVNFYPVPWGDYDQKMQVKIAAGEAFDIMFTSNWMNNYYLNIANEALLPLDDLLAEHAPNTLAMLPQMVWDGTKVNNKIYGVPNQQIMARQPGFVYDKGLLEKYQFDYQSVKTLSDVTPFLQQAMETEPETETAGLVGKMNFGDMFPYYNWEDIGGVGVVGAVDITDAGLKVFNQFDSDEFKEFANTRREWNELGYIPRDLLTSTTFNQKKAIFSVAATVKPGLDEELKRANGKDFVIQPLGEALLTTSSIVATMNGISSTSSNPERAMMFIELMNTDKEFYNLFLYGLEGKHYIRLSDDRIERAEGTRYRPGNEWAYGNTFNAYLTPGLGDNVWTDTQKLNNESKRSPLMGFVFDVEPVKAEIANSQAAFTEFHPMISAGISADVDGILKQFNDKLKAAGADKIIAEKQRQIDAFLNQ